jgi:hypothetical protein
MHIGETGKNSISVERNDSVKGGTGAAGMEDAAAKGKILPAETTVAVHGGILKQVVHGLLLSKKQLSGENCFQTEDWRRRKTGALYPGMEIDTFPTDRSI